MTKTMLTKYSHMVIQMKRLDKSSDVRETFQGPKGPQKETFEYKKWSKHHQNSFPPFYSHKLIFQEISHYQLKIKF